MQNHTTARFNNILEMVRTHTTELKANVQEALITACYFAFKDGNTTPLNAVLDAATHGKAVDVKRITMWVELHSGIARIKKEQFVLVKSKRDECVVTDEATFAEVEKLLRTVAWYDIMPKTKAKSVFDIEAFLESAVKQITKHADDPDAQNSPEQFEAALRDLKALKGKLAILAIEGSEGNAE